jgi:hypothetical protein
MFSITLALIAIFGIALTNLFLGFASAMLIGRGPKSWSQIDDAVSVRYFSPRLVLPGAKRAAEPRTEKPVPGAADLRAVKEVVEVERPAPVATTAVEPPAPVASPSRSAAWDSTSHKLVLPRKPSAAPEDDGPPEAVFARQLDAWRASQSREETPCLSGIMVTVQDQGLGDHARAALMNAASASIVGQLRKDRRVLRIADDQFLWFSPDVSPDEGLAPVERTRQILHNTRFMHEGSALAVSIQAAVVAVSDQDRPPALIQRLQRTLQYSRERGEGPTCMDVGDGPGFVQPLKLDLDEVECVLQ